MTVGKITFRCPVCGLDCKGDLLWKKTLEVHMAKVRKLNEGACPVPDERAPKPRKSDSEINGLITTVRCGFSNEKEKEALDTPQATNVDTEQGVQEQEGVRPEEGEGDTENNVT
jgi:hypothetical protein